MTPRKPLTVSVSADEIRGAAMATEARASAALAGYVAAPGAPASTVTVTGAEWVPSIAFVVDGPPVCWQRVHARKGTPHIRMVPAKTRRYEARVGERALITIAQTRKPWDKSARYVLTVRAFFPDARRRDLSNVVKAIEDGLIGVVYADDSQITGLHAYGAIDREHPRTEVYVEIIEAQADEGPKRKRKGAG